MVVPLVFHDELTLLGAKVFDKVSSSTSSVLFILFRISSCSFDNNHKTITFHFLFVLAEKVVVKSAFLSHYSILRPQSLLDSVGLAEKSCTFTATK